MSSKDGGSNTSWPSSGCGKSGVSSRAVSSEFWANTATRPAPASITVTMTASLRNVTSVLLFLVHRRNGGIPGGNGFDFLVGQPRGDGMHHAERVVRAGVRFPVGELLHRVLGRLAGQRRKVRADTHAVRSVAALTRRNVTVPGAPLSDEAAQLFLFLSGAAGSGGRFKCGVIVGDRCYLFIVERLRICAHDRIVPGSVLKSPQLVFQVAGRQGRQPRKSSTGHAFTRLAMTGTAGGSTPVVAFQGKLFTGVRRLGCRKAEQQQHRQCANRFSCVQIHQLLTSSVPAGIS